MGLTLADIRGYISSVAYMQPGISLPDIYQRIAALAVFLCGKHSYIQIMVGWRGRSNPRRW
ncbi:hypothetical protein DOH76_27950 [Salmonella enterica subsp. enterica serovar Oranienburg]|nr:hypothetical protein [Salmonella enterica]EBI7017874.1 hypothetical protein [Salmonella enterica]EBV3243252.1 hypothetical protein [Salmonella enterica subsp. enterica serovar Oranienburg]ECD0389011.1 hypothetical protein [Salmonella enterica subsp. enterica serovar Oranienburg]EGX3624927.1 hypothetical protein [Salmonella enterica]